VNTDAQALSGCEVPRVLQIGKKTTRGLGANGDANLGRMALQENADEISELLHDVDLLFLVCGLGGGTASGAAPLIASMAHQLNVMTLCFAVLPFPYESDNRKRQSEESLRALQKTADAVICLPNEKLIELVDPSAGLEDAFEASDRQVAAAIHAMWRLLNARGVLNLDFADLRHLVEKSRGLCTFGFGEAEGPARTASAVKALLDSPYLNKGRSISEATAMLVNITGGHDLTLHEVNIAAETIYDVVDENANIIFGAVIDERLQGEMRLTVIATGFNQDNKTAKSATKKPEVVSLPTVSENATIDSPPPESATPGLDIPEFLQKRRFPRR